MEKNLRIEKNDLNDKLKEKLDKLNCAHIHYNNVADIVKINNMKGCSTYSHVLIK